MPITQAEKSYTFLLTATDSRDASIQATAAATVSVQSTRVAVQIVGGDRVVSQGSAITLQARLPLTCEAL